MSKGTLSRARFCPFCGLPTIERDTVNGFKDHFVEFLCTTCNAGWRILESRRNQMANRLFKAHRELRVPTDTTDRAKEQFRKICRKQFSSIKRPIVREAQLRVGELMRQWLASEEAVRLRQEINGKQIRHVE